MKIRTPTPFISFSDGVCTIKDIDENVKYEKLGFSNNTMGFKRFYAAKAVQVDVSKVISIPFINNIDNYDKVMILDNEYDIELIQEKLDTNPRSIMLTLKDV